MTQPIISICIPTYNRAEYLKKTLLAITSENIFLDSYDIEIIISNNCSTDGTHSVCEQFLKKFPDKIKYIRQEKPVHWEKHLIKVLDYGSGEFLKLNNDTCYFNRKALEKLVNYLKSPEKNDIVFLHNKNDYIEKNIYSSFNDCIKNISYDITWISSLCINKQVYENLKGKIEHYDSLMPQVDLYGKAFLYDYNVIVWRENLMSVIEVYKKGANYNIAEVFGKKYFEILNDYIGKKNGLSKDTIEEEKHKIIKFINNFYFDLNNNFTFVKNGYFRYMLPWYKSNFYFYIYYFENILKKSRNFVIKIQKTESQRIITILNFIKIKFKRKGNKKINKWRILNSHNYTNIMPHVPCEYVKVGQYSYGTIDALLHSNGSEMLIIGDFCSIAEGVKFIVASEHPYKGLSTYPFKVKFLEQSFEAGSKGDIIVKDDVWIGLNSIILSGVTIGQGAIIGAGSVVTKDVPPYAIVGGNPAKIIKYRFEPEVIEKLVKFDFSKLDEEKIKQIGTKLYTEITKDNIDNIIEKIN